MFFCVYVFVIYRSNRHVLRFNYLWEVKLTSKEFSLFNRYPYDIILFDLGFWEFLFILRIYQYFAYSILCSATTHFLFFQSINIFNTTMQLNALSYNSKRGLLKFFIWKTLFYIIWIGFDNFDIVKSLTFLLD